MTIETRTTIQLSDIEAIEFQCKNCNVKYVYPIKQFEGPPIFCGCNTQDAWFVANSPDRSDIAKLGEVVRRFSNQPQSKFTLRLEVKGVSASREANDRV